MGRRSDRRSVDAFMRAFDAALADVTQTAGRERIAVDLSFAGLMCLEGELEVLEKRIRGSKRAKGEPGGLGGTALDDVRALLQAVVAARQEMKRRYSMTRRPWPFVMRNRGERMSFSEKWLDLKIDEEKHLRPRTKARE